MDITIQLTPAEVKALSCEFINIQEWASYIIKDRARIEMDKIIEKIVKDCLDNNINLPFGTKEEIVLASTVQTALERQKNV